MSFKIYADFEYISKRLQINRRNESTSYTEKYQGHIPWSFSYKVVCIDDKFSKTVVLYREKNAVDKFIDTTLEEYGYYSGVTKKHFNKNLVMSAEDEERFQSSNKCWICDILFDIGDNRVGEHCCITSVHSGSANSDCNINLKLTKKVPVMFHNLKGYDRHFNHARNRSIWSKIKCYTK